MYEKISRSPFIFKIMILPTPASTLKYKHTISLPFAADVATAPLLGRARFLFLSHSLFLSPFCTLLRFSLFCGLRRFALQLIISPLPAPPPPPVLPHRRSSTLSSPLYPSARASLSTPLVSLLFSHSISLSLPSFLCCSPSLSHHYYTRPYTAIMPGPDIQHNPP